MQSSTTKIISEKSINDDDKVSFSNNIKLNLKNNDIVIEGGGENDDLDDNGNYINKSEIDINDDNDDNDDTNNEENDNDNNINDGNNEDDNINLDGQEDNEDNEDNDTNDDTDNNDDNTDNDNNDYDINENANALNIDESDIHKVKEDIDIIREYTGGEIEPEWEWVKKISIVYTWVDGSDIDFLDEKSKYNGGERRVNSRDRSADELRYSLRSLEKYLPWHKGTIYIVTNNQIPAWLDISHPRIKIVDHKEIIPNHIYPTFDSGTIELFFDKIPGITERFIYFNDDIFINNYIHPSFFFTSETFYPKVYRRYVTNISKKKLDKIIRLNNIHEIFQASKYFTLNVIRNYFDENFKYRDLFHTGHVLYRDLYEPFRQLFKEELMKNCGDRFRSPYKVQVIYLYQTFMQYATQHEDFPKHFGGNGLASQFKGYTLPKSRTIKNYSCKIIPASIGDELIKFGKITDNSKVNNRYFNLYRSYPNSLIYNFNDAYSKNRVLYEFTQYMITRYPDASSFEKKEYVDLELQLKPEFDEVNEFSRYIQSGIPENYNKYNLNKFREVIQHYKNVLIRNYIIKKKTLSGEPKHMSDREMEEIEFLTNYQGKGLEREWRWAEKISFVYILENGDEEEDTNKYELLKLSIRSLVKYLPWRKGTIYIVSQKDVNDRFKDLKVKNLQIIHQNQFIPEAASTTNNSHVIEMFFDKIPGISERFVYLKNNHFFINYTHPRFFFSKQFYPKYNLMAALTEEEILNNSDKPFINTYEVIREYFGKTYITNLRKFKDAPYPLYRDLFEPARQLYAEQVEETITHLNYDNNDFLPLYMVSTYNIYGTEQAYYPDYVVGYGKIRNAEPPTLNRKRTIDYYGFDITSPQISSYTLLSDIAFTSIDKENTNIMERIKNSTQLFMNIGMKKDDEYVTLKDIIPHINTLYN
ncbi:hypothetical protein BCR36DRAFT_582302 [Piromyces finnis]|uniref:Stealth protein CR2 conserved region 2 domain-containing protein n=1 Tax=Piromyces finnis TaxID=1754191 RepID=A0A1Y1VCS9_9FUNG|nr:hypothetical protein BCR36DRAFT_582302 [Piromyces finnis]|eukprot:ORX52890.1 hypothetical protein BCR36DRAFT_582302 [Piromyces finnis]